MAVLWLYLGNKTFVAFAAYIVGYPFVIILWRLPKLLFFRWPVVVAFAPTLYGAVTTFRETFVLYTLALIAALVVVVAESHLLLIPSMVILGLFLLSHYWRSIQRAYHRDVFEGLTRWARKLRETIESGAFTFRGAQSGGEQPQVTRDQELSTFFLFHTLADGVAGRVSDVARSRKYELCLIASLLFTVVLTVGVYAFEYLALRKVSLEAFVGAENPGIWAFVGFSFSVLMTSGLSPISPATVGAQLICNSELAAALLLLVIFVFLVFTSRREGANEQIQRFASELRQIGSAVERRLRDLHQITIAEVEVVLLRSNPSLINSVRRYQGKPELRVVAMLADSSTKADESLPGSGGSGTV